ncbi:MAG: phytanoyl-CoA dioxygenase family protein [Candidatus Poribacteria bacterium]|nr:phytanoyl-CoA dioxygenase family protein [Candidatus Poribacteria bacterium]
MIDKQHLLSDEEVADFVCKGYILVNADFPQGFNEAVYDECARATDGENPGDAILDRVPKLHEVFKHEKVFGALVSLLGEDVQMNNHRHCHVNPPGSRSQGWHQDGTNQRHHQIRTVLAMYYPQDVTTENGPTVVVPGTHFRNAPTDRIATYTNIKEQVPVVGPAGTVAITHYDIWHAASRNKSDKTRFMLKFLFNRASEPTAPSWNHDPARLGAAHGRLGQRAIACGQTEHYTERRLRREMWNHLMGNASA